MSVDEQAKAVIAFRGDDTSPKGAIRFFLAEWVLQLPEYQGVPVKAECRV